MRSRFLLAFVLLAAIAAGQTDDSDVPVLKRRPAASENGTPAAPPPVAAPEPAPLPQPSAPPAVTPPPGVSSEDTSTKPDTTREVILTRSGGVLRVTVADPDDADGAGQINLGLRDAAAQYRRGEFEGTSAPLPGASVMRQMRSRIVYTAHAIDRGAELIISSQDQKAVQAIHQFLQAQKGQQ